MRNCLLALATLATAALAPLPASAQNTRADNSCGFGGFGFGGDRNCGSRFPETYPPSTATNCPPGQVPHVFPNGNGFRCTFPDGSL